MSTEPLTESSCVTRSPRAAAGSPQCVILVGGMGSRLGSLTRECAKPMLEVGGRPFIDYVLHEVGRHGFRRILLLAGHRSEDFIRHFTRQYRVAPDIDLDITHVVEPAPAGTGGALRHAAAHLDAEFLLLNGDSLFDINLLDLCSRPVEGPWLGRLALREIEDASRFGAVLMHGERVQRFLERPAQPGPGLINAGIYFLKREIIETIQVPCSLERDVLPRLAEQGALFGRSYDGFFVDIGTPEDLARARQSLPGLIKRGAAFLDRDGVLNVDGDYVHRPQQFEWIAGAQESIKWLNDAGFFVFVVTNQAGVARGYYSEREVGLLHDWIDRSLLAAGAHIDAFRYCPHHAEAGVGDYRRACNWRKPEPGMLRDILARWPVRPERSFLIGDKPSDLEAARRAGLPGFLFEGGDLRSFMRKIGAEFLLSPRP